MKKIFMLMMILTLTGIFAGCSNVSDTGKAAINFYNASNDKDYKEAEKYIAQEVYDYAESRGYDIKEAIDVFTQDGNMKKVKVVSEEINDKTATVVVKVTFNSDNTLTKELPMYLEDGTWKVGLEQ